MIVYYHPTSVNPPPFLTGARDVSIRQSLHGGCFFGIGPVYLCGFNAMTEGVVLDGGWKAMVVGAMDPFTLQREMSGQPIIGMIDMENRTWATPMILNSAGKRAFPVRYGPDFKPILSQEQVVLMEYAIEARELLPRLVGTNDEDERDELLPVACRFAARALAYANHISDEVIGKLGLLDTVLTVGVLTALCSFIDDVESLNA